MTGPRGHLRNFAERHIGGSALVLIYHRVADLPSDPQLLAVGPSNFDAQMAVLASEHQVLSVSELVDACRSRRIPDRAVAVTFDDGYADNLHAAAPILERHAVPATVFVSSGYVGGEREFWWDEIERIVLGPGTLPSELRLELGATLFEATLSGELCWTADDVAANAGWTVLDDDLNSRHTLYRRLNAFIRPLSDATRREALRQLAEAASASRDSRPTHRQLTAEQVAELDSRPMTEVGGHTTDHVLLSAQDAAEQRTQIVSDKSALERICNREITTFSYPFGSLSDYTDTSVDIVAAAGYAGACSNHPGVVKPWTDPFRLPRCIVRDWDADTFRVMLGSRFRDR